VDVGIMRGLPGEPGNRVSKPVNRTGPAAVLRGPWVPRHFWRATRRAYARPCGYGFRPWLARHPYPSLETGPGDEPRWRMNVLGDIEQSWLTVIPVAEDQARV